MAFHFTYSAFNKRAAFPKEESDAGSDDSDHEEVQVQHVLNVSSRME